MKKAAQRDWDSLIAEQKQAMSQRLAQSLSQDHIRDQIMGQVAATVLGRVRDQDWNQVEAQVGHMFRIVKKRR